MTVQHTRGRGFPTRGGDVTGRQWNPHVLGGVAQWLDAQDSRTVEIGTGVSAWRDKSGHGRDLVQATATRQPTYSGTGAAAKLLFDGIDDRMGGAPFFEDIPAMTAFVVLTTTTAVLSRPIYNEDSAAAPAGALYFVARMSSATLGRNSTQIKSDAATTVNGEGTETFYANGTPVIISHVDRRANNGVDVYRNGTANFTGAGTAVFGGAYTPTALSLAFRTAFPSVFAAIAMHEIIVYGRALTTTERQMVEGYVAHRWAIATLLPPSHPYKDGPPA